MSEKTTQQLGDNFVTQVVWSYFRANVFVLEKIKFEAENSGFNL